MRKRLEVRVALKEFEYRVYGIETEIRSIVKDETLSKKHILQELKTLRLAQNILWARISTLKWMLGEPMDNHNFLES